jgi:hypothetical protein
MSELPPESNSDEEPWIAGFHALREELIERGIVTPEAIAESKDLLAKLQTPESKEAMRNAFQATPQELGEAARKAAEKPTET